MRNAVLLILIISTNIIHTQSNTIEQYVYGFHNLEHIGCVRSISVKNSRYSNRENKIDTLTRTYKVTYDKNDNILKRFDFWKGIEKPTQVIIYDSLKRVLSIERNDGNKKTEIINQYFSNNSKYPDSVNVYSGEFVKKQQTINDFIDNLVVKQAEFRDDTLRYYSIFQYDSKKRLVKNLNINTKYGSGIIRDKSFTGTVTIKDLSPDDSTFYKYENKLDTLIVYKYQENILEKVKKTLKNDTVDIEIDERYWNGKLLNRLSKFQWKDSLKTEFQHYNDRLELDEYNRIITYDDRIVRKWRNSMTNGRPENVQITKIQKEYDKYGNWIYKAFIRNEFKEKEIQREIEYYCQ